MVRRDRNHPSVIVWSIGNEVSEAWNSDDVGVERARTLNKIVKGLILLAPLLWLVSKDSMISLGK